MIIHVDIQMQLRVSLSRRLSGLCEWDLFLFYGVQPLPVEPFVLSLSGSQLFYVYGQERGIRNYHTLQQHTVIHPAPLALV